MELLLEVHGPRLRAQVEGTLREAVRSGRLRPGTRLPATRVLATQLGVSRGVVVEAYAQLVAEGHFAARTGAGTWVAEARPPDVAVGAKAQMSEPPAPRYDLRIGLPDADVFPRGPWQRASHAALRGLSTADLTSAGVQGSASLRTALADALARVRGGRARVENVIVTAGLADGLSLLWRTLRARGGHRVAIEDPAWTAHRDTLREAGLEPVPVPTDESGLVVDDLERAHVDAVVVTPAHQYPLGAVLSRERRSALLSWARRRGALIVEDDYDAEFRHDAQPVAALQGSGPECVVYGASVSKVLSPGIRIGWMIAPDALVPDLVSHARITRASPSVIEQTALAILIETGDLERHVRRTRLLYRLRRDALARAIAEHLPRARISATSGGLHLVAWLWGDLDDVEVAARARASGIAVDALHGHCALCQHRPPALLLGYAALREDTLARAVAELAKVIASPRSP